MICTRSMMQPHRSRPKATVTRPHRWNGPAAKLRPKRTHDGSYRSRWCRLEALGLCGQAKNRRPQAEGQAALALHTYLYTGIQNRQQSLGNQEGMAERVGFEPH